MFLYKDWEKFCKKLNEMNYNSVTAKSLLNFKNHNQFLVLKHDVETNPKKALEIAKIESKYNHQGSYYCQADLLKNNKNMMILKKIKELGHEVSYHHDVMDSNKGDIHKASLEFEKKMKLFNKNGFNVVTVCQHGNPVIKRENYFSNRDFFRNQDIRMKYDNIFEIMVNFRDCLKMDYDYISDSGYGWKIIYDPENNDRIDTSQKDIDIQDLDGVFDYVKNNSSIIVSTHPHRWNKNWFLSKFRYYIFNLIKFVGNKLKKNPILKKIFSKYYYLARKL